MGLLRKKYAVFNAVKSIKNEMKIYQKSIIMGYGHEKRFYKILKIRFFEQFGFAECKHFYSKCIPHQQLND